MAVDVLASSYPLFCVGLSESWSLRLLTFDSPRIALGFAGLSGGFVIALPETFASKLLRVRAARLNREAGYQKFIAPDDLNRQGFWMNFVCFFFFFSFLFSTDWFFGLARLSVTPVFGPIRALYNEFVFFLRCFVLAFFFSVF